MLYAGLEQNGVNNLIKESPTMTINTLHVDLQTGFHENTVILYHEVVRFRAEILKDLGEEDQAHEEIEALREDLDDRGVNQSVLNDIEAFSENL
jgi:hypothetical protein